MGLWASQTQSESDTARSIIIVSENKHSATVEAGTPVQIHSSGVGFVPAIADDVTHQAIGLLSESCLVGANGIVKTGGKILVADWTGIIGAATLTRGDYYLSGSEGEMTQTAPGSGFVQSLGESISTTEFLIEVENPIRL